MKNNTTATNATATATNNATVNEILESLEVIVDGKERKLSPYAVNAMRPAIIKKSVKGRAKAIDSGFCEECGVSKLSLGEWTENIDTLYELSKEYSASIGKDNEEEARNQLWKVWKSVLRVGVEDPVNGGNLFVREKDVENLRVLAAESREEFIPGKGFVPVMTGKTAFRGKIETRIAIRIAGNAILGDTDRDTVTDYRKAVKAISTCREQLEGYTRGKDEIPSLYTRLESLENEYAEAGEVSGKVQKRYENLIAELKKQVDATEKRFLKALEAEKNLREKYEAILGKIEALEGAEEDAKPDPAKVPAGQRKDRLKTMMADYLANGHK